MKKEFLKNFKKEVMETVELLEINPKKDIPEAGKQTLSFIADYCQAVANQMKHFWSWRKRQQEEEHKKRVEKAVEKWVSILQEEVFELMGVFPTGKYFLHVKCPQSIQILVTQYREAMNENGQPYLYILCLVRISRTSRQPFTRRDDREFLKDFTNSYYQRREAAIRFATPERFRQFFPCLAAGYKIRSCPSLSKNDSAIYFALSLKIFIAP